TLLAVTGSARELDEEVRAHRNVRVARIAAAVAASTASSQCNSRKARCDYVRNHQGDAAHIASIRLRRREFNLVRSIGPTLDPPRCELPEVAAHRSITGRRTCDVVLGSAELEVAVPGRPGRAHVAVERHPRAARIDEVGPVR